MERKSDFVLGLAKEKEVFDLLKKYFNCPDLKKDSDKFGRMDFYDSNTNIELKSRRVPFNKYHTTIISQSKIEYCKGFDKTNYFVFCFTDGIYYIEYQKEIFDLFEVRKESIYRDGIEEKKINCHIPTKYLIKII